MAPPCGIFVMAADRGHFNWSLPLANALVTPKVLQEEALLKKVEYWTSEESQSWLTGADLAPEVSLGGATGSFSQTKKLIEIFTELSSSGDTDEEGGKALEEHFETELQRRMGSSLEQAFSTITPPKEVQDPLLERLRLGDVAVVVYEQTWCSWVEALAKQAGVPSISFQPSYIDVFRHSAGGRPRAFQGSFDFGKEGMVYTLAGCLRHGAAVPEGRYGVGAMLPMTRSSRVSCEEKELMNWLSDGEPVVYCSLGSHMLSRVLAPGSLTALIEGILAARCRVLFVLSKSAREFADQDPNFWKVSGSEAVRLPQWVNQPAVLAHPSVALFLSHCGANSLHEALACGLPILALPFFDDQHYNAAALEAQNCARRIAKRPVKVHEVTAGVKQLLSPEAKAAAEKLQHELLAEHGTYAAARHVQRVME